MRGFKLDVPQRLSCSVNIAVVRHYCRVFDSAGGFTWIWCDIEDTGTAIAPGLRCWECWAEMLPAVMAGKGWRNF